MSSTERKPTRQGEPNARRAGAGSGQRETRSSAQPRNERRSIPPARTASAAKASAPASAAATALASVLGFATAAIVAGCFVWASGCGSEPPPGASTNDPPRRTSSLPAPPPTARAKASASAAPSASAAVAAADAGAPDAAPEKPYDGPLLGALALQTPVWPTMEYGKHRLGYIRLGGKVPVDPTPIKKENCTQGWYHLVDGGYVCGKWATTDMASPQIKLGITPPNIDDVLPYKYAINTAHGTPLYRSVPSKEDMIKYEPYLEIAKKARAKKKDEVESDATGSAVPSGDDKPAADTTTTATADTGDKASAEAQAAALGLLDGGAPLGDEAPPEEEKPWWQRKYEKGKHPEVKLEDLEQDSDGTIAKRMVKGFFIAVDKTFGWNGRLWYKTTDGLVAPADRMYLAKPPTSQGIEVPAGVKQVGFILAKKAAKYEIDPEKKTVDTKGTVSRFDAFGLTGETISIKDVVYRQTTEGWWMKGADGTYTDPGPPPADLAPGEKWIDVNLTRKTLLAFEGDRPVYAALVSPGKKSKIKAKDHSTVKGTFRIREKHITVTMDGDGAVAGDLPYSIEDVPYVEYFEGSYALHGAFWHSNFGHEMSHGCVNLSPLDAKKLFFWTEPKLPRGWHAVWSTPEHRGTLVVTHD